MTPNIDLFENGSKDGMNPTEDIWSSLNISCTRGAMPYDCITRWTRECMERGAWKPVITCISLLSILVLLPVFLCWEKLAHGIDLQETNGGKGIILKRQERRKRKEASLEAST